jgi:hypothetical protein
MSVQLLQNALKKKQKNEIPLKRKTLTTEQAFTEERKKGT